MNFGTQGLLALATQDVHNIRMLANPSFMADFLRSGSTSLEEAMADIVQGLTKRKYKKGDGQRADL